MRRGPVGRAARTTPVLALGMALFGGAALLGACPKAEDPAAIDCEKMNKKLTQLSDAPLTVRTTLAEEGEKVLESSAVQASEAASCVALRTFVDDVEQEVREKHLLLELQHELDTANALRSDNSRVSLQFADLCKAECESQRPERYACEIGCGCSVRDGRLVCPSRKAKRCRSHCKAPSQSAQRRGWNRCMAQCKERAVGPSDAAPEVKDPVADLMARLEKVRDAGGRLDAVSVLSARLHRATQKDPALLPPAHLALSKSCCPPRRKVRDDGLCLAHTDYRYLHCLLTDQRSERPLSAPVCCDECLGAKKGDVCDIRGAGERCYVECVKDARRRPRRKSR